MIRLKSLREAELMRQAGKITAEALRLAGRMVKPGVTTKEIDTAVSEFIRSRGAIPTFLNYNGFPASICASVNEQVIHGIPGDRALRDGDIISVDVGATKDGYVGDSARTFAVGHCSSEALRLIEVTKKSFFEGIKYAREGYRISDISHAVQSFVEQNGFSVVREYVGHGIGSSMHEPPEVPNFGSPGHGVRVVRGMTIAVEPMVNAGGPAIRTLRDGWTVVTLDGSLSAHYENTILVTDGEPEILTTAGETSSYGGL
jgi:methionyl aminopeptidase